MCDLDKDANMKLSRKDFINNKKNRLINCQFSSIGLTKRFTFKTE